MLNFKRNYPRKRINAVATAMRIYHERMFDRKPMATMINSKDAINYHLLSANPKILKALQKIMIKNYLASNDREREIRSIILESMTGNRFDPSANGEIFPAAVRMAWGQLQPILRDIRKKAMTDEEDYLRAAIIIANG